MIVKKLFIVGCFVPLLLAGCTQAPPGGNTTNTTNTTTSNTTGATMSPSPNSTTAAVEWKEFTAENGAFSAMFPSEPKVDNSGGKLKVESDFGVDRAVNVNWEAAKAPPISKETADKMVKAMEEKGAKVTKHEMIDFQGSPALSATIEVADAEGELIFVIKDENLYELGLTRKKSAPAFTPEERSKFIDSVKLTTPSGTAATPAVGETPMAGETPEAEETPAETPDAEETPEATETPAE
jgi:hypothetical protein